MNFTHPDSDKDDDPKDWLISSLFFVGALGHLLEDTEGVIVKAKNDLAELVGDENLYIVHRDGYKIVISKTSDKDVSEGDMVWMDKEPSETN